MNNSARRIATFEQRTRHIDKHTGEITLDEVVLTDISGLAAEPAYVKLYIDDLGRLCNLTDGQRSILLYVAACVDYSGFVLLPTGQKERIAKSAGCSISAINNAITHFCKNNILRKEGGGLYELNPDYFARGKWREIRERRKEFYTKTTYRRDGTKEVETNVIEALPDVG
ncbi:MAG: replication/maintenance protein RepL [Methylococcaceae bacterium]